MLYFHSNLIQTAQTVVKLLFSLLTLSPLVPTMESATSSSKRRTRQTTMLERKPFCQGVWMPVHSIFASGKPSVHAVKFHFRDRSYSGTHKMWPDSQTSQIYLL